MAEERITNRMDLTSDSVSVYTTTAVGRPPKPDSERRSKLFPLRLTPNELEQYERAARRLEVTVADILRQGAALLIKRDKGEHKRKEKP